MIIAIASPPTIDVTQAVELLRSRHGLALHADPTRKVVEGYGFQTLYDMPAGLQRKVREALIRDHVAIVRERPDALFDHSVINWLADWMRWFWGNTSGDAWEQMLSIATEALGHYDLVYHLEGGPVKAYDGFVWRDKNNAKQIASLLKLLCAELGVGRKLRLGLGDTIQTGRASSPPTEGART